MNDINSVSDALIDAIATRGTVTGGQWAKITKSKRSAPRTLILRGSGKAEFSTGDIWGLETSIIGEVPVGSKSSGEILVVQNQVEELSSEVESIKNELVSCKEGINTIIKEIEEKPSVRNTIIFDLDEKLELLHAIPIVIEDYEDEVIAMFPEIEVFGSGFGESEAIMNLKNEIINLYIELKETPEKELGRLPKSWKRVLSKVVKEIDKN